MTEREFLRRIKLAEGAVVCGKFTCHAIGSKTYFVYNHLEKIGRNKVAGGLGFAKDYYYNLMHPYWKAVNFWVEYNKTDLLHRLLTLDLFKEICLEEQVYKGF